MNDTAQSTTSGWKAKVLKGSSLEVLGFGIAQIFRLGGNVVLTRLLVPEAFGLVAMVSLLNAALVMFSDFGFFPAIIQHPRGGEARFLNTAWTLQLVRAAVLTPLLIVLAWPMAWLFEEPTLVALFHIGAINLIAANATSTGLYTLRRNLRVGPLAVLDFLSQLVSTVIMVAFAYWLRTVWALAIGSAIGACIRTGATYFLPGMTRHRLCWDREAVSHVLGFGKWVLGSSAIHFLSRQGDRLMLGKLLGMTQLGIYSIAVTLSEAMSLVVTRVVSFVVFPALARVREQGVKQLSEAHYKVRMVLDAMSLPALGALAALSSVVIELIYDPRYHEAGWMLRALCVRVAMMCVLTPSDSCLLALGQARFTLIQGVARSVWLFVGAPIGFYFFGIHGLVWAVALSELPVAVVVFIPLHRTGILRPKREFLAPVLFVAGGALGFALEGPIRNLLF